MLMWSPGESFIVERAISGVGCISARYLLTIARRSGANGPVFRLPHLVLAFAMLFSLLPLAAQAPGKPSFDCAAATQPVEQIICNDVALSDADAQLAKLYAAVQTSAYGKGRPALLSTQREWLAQRNRCSARAGPIPKAEDQSQDGAVECVRGFYHRRNNELAMAILLDKPELALATLRQDSPKLAPLYEALTLYMAKEEGADWKSTPKTRGQIIALLRPYFTDMASDPDKSYGNSVLEGVAVSAEDGVTSDHKFAASLSLLSMYLDDADYTAGGIFPCAALVQRPDMISAVQPYFGSTLDNFLMYDDCEQTLPAQPRLAALRKALNGYWDDDCGGGTMRFAVYRSYAVQATSAQIGYPVGDSKLPPLKRKGLNPKLVTAALAELVDQYQRYRGLSKSEAEQRARGWLGAMIEDAGKCYEE
jgi:uncharacterized protein YecT (DUF1311 family)